MPFLEQDQEQRISDTVTRVEKGTRAEIVPMIVERSSTIRHVPVLLFFVFSTIVLALHLLFYEELDLMGLNIYFWLAWVGLFPLSWWLSRFPFFQRWMIPDQDEIFQVMERAQLEFYHHELENTELRSAVLIFVSLMERRCVVLADRSISKHCSPETWQQAVKLIIDGIHSKQVGDGFVNAIEHCGRELSKIMPASDTNPNEISNRLIVKS